MAASKEKAATSLGATHFVATGTEGALDPWQGKFNLIVDTVSAPHPMDPLAGLLASFGTLVLVGLPPLGAPVDVSALVHGNRSVAGSNIGGIPETQEMLDYCGRKAVEADVEVIRADQVNTAYKRMLAGDVRYRFVIDAATLVG